MLNNVYFKCQHDLQRGAGVTESLRWTEPPGLHDQVISSLRQGESTGYLLLFKVFSTVAQVSIVSLKDAVSLEKKIVVLILFKISKR